MKNAVPCGPTLSAPVAWKLIVDGARSGEENMRRDREALEAQRESAAGPTVRLYRWVEPTLSFGRLQPRTSAETLASARGARAVVQRPTGGGMVLHDADVSFSVVWRREEAAFPSCIRNVYRLFHQALADELLVRGVVVSLHAPKGSPLQKPGLCYEEFSEDDVLWGGRKLVGGALRITRFGRLYQGNLKGPPALTPAERETLITRAFETRVFGRAPRRVRG